MSSKLRYENGRFVSDATPEEREQFRKNAQSFKTAPSAMPSRSGAAGEKKAWDKLDKDMGSYKRLRDEGLQPPSINGCNDLEKRAETKMEVEAGTIMSNDNNRKATEKLLADTKVSN